MSSGWRVMRYPVAPEILGLMLQTGRAHRIASGLPDGAQARSAFVDPDARTIRLVVEHESFEPVAFGAIMPEAEPVMIQDVTADLSALRAVADAARLRRNTRMRDGEHKGFSGDWVAVPASDFDTLRAALARLERRQEGRRG